VGCFAIHINRVYGDGWAHCWYLGAGMRAFSGLFVVALTVPLAGCFGLTASLTAPKDVPSWAMSSQAQPNEEPRTRTARRTRPQRERVAAEHTSSATLPIQTGNAAMPTNTDRRRVRTSTQPAAQASSPTAYSAEWHAQEEAADAQLRRRMNICSGC
jgi:hypothetical protein